MPTCAIIAVPVTPLTLAVERDVFWLLTNKELEMEITGHGRGGKGKGVEKGQSLYQALDCTANPFPLAGLHRPLGLEEALPHPFPAFWRGRRP